MMNQTLSHAAPAAAPLSPHQQRALEIRCRVEAFFADRNPSRVPAWALNIGKPRRPLSPQQQRALEIRRRVGAFFASPAAA